MTSAAQLKVVSTVLVEVLPTRYGVHTIGTYT